MALLVMTESSRGLRVHQGLQLLPGLEVRHALARDLDRLAGLRIPPLARPAPAHAKAAEAPELDLGVILRRQGMRDAIEDSIDDDFRVLLRQVDLPGHLLYEIGFGHGIHLLLSPIPVRINEKPTTDNRKPVIRSVG